MQNDHQEFPDKLFGGSFKTIGLLYLARLQEILLLQTTLLLNSSHIARRYCSVLSLPTITRYLTTHVTAHLPSPVDSATSHSVYSPSIAYVTTIRTLLPLYPCTPVHFKGTCSFSECGSFGYGSIQFHQSCGCDRALSSNQ